MNLFGRPASLRLPLAPLLAFSGLDRVVTPVEVKGRVVDVVSTNAVFAEIAGISTGSVFKWQRQGVPIKAAEDICHKLGFHPCEVWGGLWVFTAGCPLADLV